MAVRSEIVEAQTFRPHLLTAFVPLLVAGTLAALAVNLSLQALGYTLPSVASWSFVRVLFLAYLWALACTPILVIALSVRTDADGLTGRTFWGRKRRIGWDEIASVRNTRGGRFGFWVVASASPGAPVWVPRFVKNPAVLETHLQVEP